MTIQLAVNVRNARLDAIETNVGTSPILRIRTGAAPANCATSDSGTVLATLNLPSDWANGASGGSKSLLGTWEDTSADASGTAGHFRMYDSGDSECKIQGTITATSGGGDMELDNVVLASGQVFNVTTFTLTDGNA